MNGDCYSEDTWWEENLTSESELSYEGEYSDCLYADDSEPLTDGRDAVAVISAASIDGAAELPFLNESRRLIPVVDGGTLVGGAKVPRWWGGCAGSAAG